MTNLNRPSVYLSQAFHMLTTKGTSDVTEEFQSAAKKAAHWHKFIIDPAQFGDHMAPALYADDLRAHGLFQLPFDNLVIWMGPYNPGELGSGWDGHETASVAVLVFLSRIDGNLVGRLAEFALYPSAIAMNPASSTYTFPLSMSRQDWVASDGYCELDEVEKKQCFTENGTLMLGGSKPAPLAEAHRLEKRIFALTIFELVGLLNAEGIVSQEHREPKFINKKRAKTGEAPLFGYHLLSVDTSSIKMPGVVSQGGTHASPRLHWRRGHVRKLSTGKITMVRPCLVGDVSRGALIKDYNVH